MPYIVLYFELKPQDKLVNAEKFSYWIDRYPWEDTNIRNYCYKIIETKKEKINYSDLKIWYEDDSYNIVTPK